jgi:hypothetical protein
MTRDEFSKEFLDRGTKQGIPTEELRVKFRQALADFDKSQGITPRKDVSKSNTGNPVIDWIGNNVAPTVQNVSRMIPDQITNNLPTTMGTVAGMVTSPMRLIPGIGRTLNAVGTGVGTGTGELIKNQIDVLQGDNPNIGMEDTWLTKPKEMFETTVADPYRTGAVAGATSLAFDYATDNPIVNPIKAKIKDVLVNNPVSQGASKIIQSMIPKSKDVFASMFKLPSSMKIFKRINPQEVSEEMVNYNLGGKTLDEMDDVVNTVTGKEGIFPKMTRAVVDQIDGLIDNGSAISDAKSVLSTSTELNKLQEQKVLLKIQKVIDNHLVTATGEKVPLDAFQAQKDLENIAYSAIAKGTDAQGTVSRLAQQEADAYLAAADALSENIKNKITPEMIDSVKEKYAKQVGDTLGDYGLKKFMAIKDIDGFRAFQKNWVRLGQMIDYTKMINGGLLTKALQQKPPSLLEIPAKVAMDVANNPVIKSGAAQIYNRAEGAGKSLFDILGHAIPPAVGSYTAQNYGK